MEDEIKARKAFFWALRLLLGTAIIYLGIVSFKNYETHSFYPEIVGNTTEGGIALITIGLSVLWLGLLMFLYERKGERRISRKLNVSITLLTVLFLTATAYLAIFEVDNSKHILLGIAASAFLLTTGSVILFRKPLQLAQAFREHKIISLAAMVLLLLLLASAATYGYVHQYNVDVISSMRGCGDKLRTIDNAIMQYSATNIGRYPETMDDLMGTYIRTGSLNEQYGHYYYLDTSGRFPRAACSKGHTY